MKSYVYHSLLVSSHVMLLVMIPISQIMIHYHTPSFGSFFSFLMGGWYIKTFKSLKDIFLYRKKKTLKPSWWCVTTNYHNKKCVILSLIQKLWCSWEKRDNPNLVHNEILYSANFNFIRKQLFQHVDIVIYTNYIDLNT